MEASKEVAVGYNALGLSCKGGILLHNIHSTSITFSCTYFADSFTSCTTIVFFSTRHCLRRSISSSQSIARYVRDCFDIPTGSSIVNNARLGASSIILAFLKDTAVISAMAWAWTRAEHLPYFVVLWSSLVAFTPTDWAYRFAMGSASSTSTGASSSTELLSPMSTVTCKGAFCFAIKVGEINLVRCHAFITVSAQQGTPFKIS